MERSKKITYIVATFMFLIELRPLEPFMTAYLTGPDGNVSLSEVATVLEAIKSYSALFVSIIMLTTADYLLYKPNIVFVIVWSCLSYFYMTNSPTLSQIRVSVVGIGAMCTWSSLAYSYLYVQIDDARHFQTATGIVTAAMQLGKVVGDLSAQVIVNATGGGYTVLPYCNVCALLLGLIWACRFPSVKRKINFPNTKGPPNEKSLIFKYGQENTRGYREKIWGKNYMDIKKCNIVVIVLEEMRTQFTTSFSNPLVLKCSLWYIFAMAAYILVLANMNVLYSYVIEKSSNHDVLLNGLAEAIVTTCGAVGAYLIGNVRLDWTRYGDAFTAVCSVLIGVLMMSCYFYDHIHFIYSSYALFGFLFQANFVIKQTEIAKNLTTQCYSLVLEFNFIVSLIIVNVVTLFLVQFNFMSVTIPGRFLFIGGSFVALGIAFAFNMIFFQGNKEITVYCDDAGATTPRLRDS